MSNIVIRIASTEYNPNARALEIYVSGCTRKCKGCHNIELQDYSRGILWEEWLVKNNKKLHNPLIKRLWILGGDLLCQDIQSYHDMMSSFKKHKLEMWLWTGCEYDKIPSDFQIWKYFDVVKAGPYDCGDHKYSFFNIVTDNGAFKLRLSGSNQQIYLSRNKIYPLSCS